MFNKQTNPDHEYIPNFQEKKRILDLLSTKPEILINPEEVKSEDLEFFAGLSRPEMTDEAFRYLWERIKSNLGTEFDHSHHAYTSLLAFCANCNPNMPKSILKDVYNTKVDNKGNDDMIAEALAKNSNLPLEIAQKLFKTKLRNTKEIIISLASNSSEAFTLSFLKSLPKRLIDETTATGLVEKNIEDREQKLAAELGRSYDIFGGEKGYTHKGRDWIDLTQSIRACNKLGQLIKSIPIQPNNLETGIVKYEEIKPESLEDLLNSNNSESLVGMVARIKEFFNQLEETSLGKAKLWYMLKSNKTWQVAYKTSKEFRLEVIDINAENYKYKNKIRVNNSVRRGIDDNDFQVQLFDNCEKEFGLFENNLQDKNKDTNKEIDSIYNYFRIARDDLKAVLSELKNTELPTTEQLKLIELERLEEQKLIDQGPLAIAQKEFEENLKKIGDPAGYVKSEQLRNSTEQTRIQPFLQNFWDKINLELLNIDNLNYFKLPKFIIDESGKRVLESQAEAKTAFLKLINNIFGSRLGT